MVNSTVYIYIYIISTLMRSHDQVAIVFLEEVRHHVRAERERHTAIVFSVASHILFNKHQRWGGGSASTLAFPPFPHTHLVGVCPQQVADEARVRHVGRSDDALDLVKRVEVR